MTRETADLILGAVIFVISFPVLYFAAGVIRRILGAWGAYILAPLAPVVGGTVDHREGCILGSYQGRDVCVSFFSGCSVGYGESATSINAFYITVLNQAGRQDWRIRFCRSGFFGRGPKKLFIETRDVALGERLHHSGVLDAIYAVSAPTDDYVTVAYSTWLQTLTYTDDVSPRRISSHEQFAVQLELVARLAEINAQVNPI